MDLGNSIEFLKKDDKEIGDVLRLQNYAKFLMSPSFLKSANSDIFFSKIEKKLKEKIARFKQFQTYPPESVVISNDVINKNKRVFYAENQEIQIENLGDFGEGLFDSLKSNFKESFTFNFANIIIYDLTKKVFLLKLERVKNIRINAVGDIESIAFLHSVESDGGKKYGVYDEEFYRVFKENDGNYVLVFEEKHDIESCPSVFFVGDYFDTSNFILRDNKFISQIGNLETFQFLMTSQNFVNSYLAFPIMQEIVTENDDEDCVNGRKFVREKTFVDGEIIEKMISKPCDGSNMIGAGTVKKIKISDDSKDLSKIDAIKFVSVPIGQMESLSLNIKHLANDIVYKSCGHIDFSSKEAVNEVQVKAQVEQSENILNQIARSLESTFYKVVSFYEKNTKKNYKYKFNLGTNFLNIDKK